MQSITTQEKEKYIETWSNEWYRQTSPAMRHKEQIIDAVQILDSKTILDAGTGKGQLLKWFVEHGYDAHGIDITLTCLDEDVKPVVKNRVTECAIHEIPLDKKYDMVISVDVLEHLPEEILNVGIKRLAEVCGGYALFIIALFPHIDHATGYDLHPSLYGVEEWTDILSQYFEVLSVDKDTNKGYFLLTPICDKCKV